MEIVSESMRNVGTVTFSFSMSASRQRYNDKFSQTSDTDYEHRSGHLTPWCHPGSANQRPRTVHTGQSEAGILMTAHNQKHYLCATQ